jgi:hypothetical protein
VGKIHAAKIETSERLQKVAAYLADQNPHTTREILIACDVCAVNSIVDELRENGFEIECKPVKRGVFEYTMTGGFTNIFRIPM